MKKRMFRIITALLALLMLTACGSTPTADAPSSSGNANDTAVAGDAAPAEDAAVEFPLAEQVTLTALTHEPSFASQELDERVIVQRLEESTNVHIDWTVYVDDQFGEKKQLALAKKDLPDIVFDAQMSQYDLLRYSKDGTIIAVDELIDQYMPNLKAVLDARPEYRALITAPDGHIYSFPWIEELGSGKEAIQAIGGIPFINQKWLTELGLDMPTTPDELTEVLRAFKAAHPDCLPLSFVMNGGNEDVGVLLSAFGYGDNPDHYIVTNEKKVIYALADEGIIPGLEWLHSLYAEGLIDPEVFTHDYNTFVSKAASDRYGVFVAWDNTSAGTPDDYVALPALMNADGEYNVTRQNAMGFEIGRCVITSTNAYPELTAQWIDQLYNPVQSVQDNWGTYGDTAQDNIFELNDDGTLKHLPIPEGVVPYELRMKTNLGGPLAILDEYYGTYTTKPDDAMLRLDIMKELYAPYMQCDYNYPPIFFDIDTTNRITQIETDLKPFAESQKAAWIMNGNVEAEWADYIEHLNQLNLQELLQLKQEGLDSYFANMG
ncbi:MAG: ABC transporter substrate-binding protein [Candidatus Onthomonas sp.]